MSAKEENVEVELTAQKTTPISRRTRGGKSKIPVMTPPKGKTQIEAGDAKESEIESDHESEIEHDSPLSSDYEEEDEVTNMTNKELKERLSSMGINTGPIVDSTRKLYERKLTKLLNRGKEAAYSTDEDAAPETPVIEEQVEEKPKRPVRTKKATKKAEEQAKDTFSDDEDNNEVQQVRKSRRIKEKKDVEEETADAETEEPVENGTTEATVDEPEESVQAEEAGTVEDAEETPAAAADEAVEAATPSTDNTASKTRVNTMLFLFLMLVACYLVHSESEIIIAKTNELTAFVVDKYTTLYYSLLPEIETTTESVDDTPPPPPSDEL